MIRAFLTRHALRVLAPESDAAIQALLPNEWIVCHFCGEAGWRVHPHFGVPCPVVSNMSEAAGLKMDADRVQAVRTGLHLEELSRVMREHFGMEDDDHE